jgi:phosphinothricin acetyltransferase
MPQLIYRNATKDDLPWIVAIYNQTIPGRMVTADLEIVSIQSRIPWFEKHQPGRRPLWVVQEEDSEIIGWVSFQDFYGRPAYNITAEISIYLDSAQQGKGIGKKVLQHCLAASPALGIKNLVGYIFAHNIPSLKLFNACGFMEWGILPDIAILDGVECSLKIVGRKIL